MPPKKTTGRAKTGSMKPGRPSAFSQEICTVICERLAEGKSLKAACAGDDMPTVSTVFRWLAASEDFQKQYMLAREIQSHVMFDEILDIADTPKKGVKRVKKDGKVETTETDMIEHRRLQIDARRWMIAKLLPKKYGDRQQVEHSGPDGGPIQTKDVSDEKLAKALANFLMRTRANVSAAQEKESAEVKRDPAS
ncbi:hypothetical protein M2322_003183 [Rhodoblastus acidophilus]|uniref:terminase small subunit-like protein n=1 Tax=Rhodoblastus acidophilus TaxID=1074 RepID=UPI00222568B5|nr:terminase small subunit protein [Rhodoblastus acidophilus]MCW2317619.1 hypothetical protein [Rhodoblastus acidophilus]